MLSVILLLTGCMVLFQSGRFQTWLAQEVASRISLAIGAKVDIRAVKIHFFDRAVLEGFYVEDLHKDTLLYVDFVEANFDEVYLDFSHFDFDHVTLRKGQFNVRQFEGEEDLNIQFILDAINGPPDTSNKVRSKPPKLFFWDVVIEDVDFTYEYRDAIPDTGFGMNYDHIRIRDIYANLKNFLIVDDSLSGKINHMKLSEASGFKVNDFSSDFVVAYTMMDFSNLHVKTPKSSLDGKVHFEYDSYDELSDFIEKVQMRGKIRKSSINLDEIAFFAPELRGLNQQVKYSGGFKGSIDHLKGFNTMLSFGQESHFIGSFTMDGLPDTEKMAFDYQIVELQTSRADLQNLEMYPFYEKTKIAIPEMLDRAGVVSYRGALSGTLDNLSALGKLSSDLGEIDTDLHLWYRSDIQQYAYEGKFGTANFMLGDLLGNKPQIGNLAFNSEIKGSGFSEDQLKTSISGKLSFIQLNGYSYSNIALNGIVNGKTYDGKLSINDQNLKMDFSGLIDLTKPQPEFDFQANIDHLNITALNLLKRDSSLILSTEIISNFKGKSIDQLGGQIELAQTSVQYGSKKYYVEDVLLEANGEPDSKSIDIYSDIVDASIKGSFQLASLPDAISNVLNSFLPSYTAININPNQTFNQNFSYDAQIKDLKLISEVFFPNIKIETGTRIFGDFKSKGNQLNVEINSPMIDISGVRFEQINSKADALNNRLKFDFSSHKMFITDSVQVNHISVSSDAVTDNLGLKINWASRKSLSAADAQINASAKFEGSKITMQMLPSLILIEDTLWKVNADNSIEIDTGLVEFNNLSFTHQNEFIRFDGKVSSRETDEIDVILDNFQLRNLNPFISNSNLKLEGSTRGIISIAGIFGQPFFKSDLDLKNIYINDDLIGDGVISSKWDPKTERILLDGQIKNSLVPKLAFNGYYIPSKEKNNIDLQLMMNNIQLSLFKKYVDDLFSDINGLADGNIHLTGSLEEPITNGTVNLKRTSVTVGLLNTRYFFAHEFKVSKNVIQAKNIQLTDENSNTGKLDFKIAHTNFDDFYFDVFLKANSLLALNTNETQSDLFYGKANASGTFRASGPLDNIVMDINAKTERGTVFYLPLTGTSDVSQQDFITFEKKGTTHKLNKVSTRKVSSKGYELNFNLEVTPEAEAFLLFDPKVGDIIKGNGSANLRMEVTEAGDFNIYGDYIIDKGDYLFTLQNVLNKKFVVQKGGIISFKGDPYDADINLSAIYKVRTSLYNLVKNIDSSAAVKRTIDVNAIMNLSDKLMKPQIKFDITIPDADDNTINLFKSQIYSEDELNKQMFSLVMLGGFMPNQGGATETTGMNSVGSNASELLSSQLSNMLSQLSDDVNIGVNYSQGGAESRDNVSVNLQTQLFNDRVSIDGNVGTANNAANTQNTTNMVGEFNIEVKLTEDGMVRIRVFNRSNQYLLMSNDVPYTQGVGLFYRREFENASDLFRKKTRD